MRLIAQLPSLFYVQADNGRVWIVPDDGRPGEPVRNLGQEADALSRHAAWLRRIGREQCADQWQTAAEALESLVGEPQAA